jgi:hypothetical protein
MLKQFSCDFFSKILMAAFYFYKMLYRYTEEDSFKISSPFDLKLSFLFKINPGLTFILHFQIIILNL